jgi:CRP-like cAMP-binding protein
MVARAKNEGFIYWGEQHPQTYLLAHNAVHALIAISVSYGCRPKPALRELIVRYNDVLLAQVQQSVACNALHSLEARLCRWLLQTHDCVDGNVIPLTQEFLGQMLGVRRTTVTIAARLLQSARLIRYRRGLIHIVDRAALEDIACECYAVVKHNADKVFAARPPLR